MASSLRNVTFDCADARALAGFWAKVLGWHVFYDDEPEIVVAPHFPPNGVEPKLLFIPVPEGRTVKNRLHLDIAPIEGARDEEVARLLELGATVVEDHRTPDGAGWVWLADPEGNDFCVERNEAERGHAQSRSYFIEVR